MNYNILNMNVGELGRVDLTINNGIIENFDKNELSNHLMSCYRLYKEGNYDENNPFKLNGFEKIFLNTVKKYKHL